MAAELGDNNPRGLHFIADLANTVQDDPGAGPAALQALVERHGGPPFTLTDADADELRRATAHLVRILATTDEDTAAGLINDLLDRYPARPTLVRLPGRPWSLHSRAPREAGLTHWLLSTAALALGLWLGERGGCAWGSCAAPDCEHWFFDTGRRTPQRYCSPRCATRVRVAAHRAQRTPAAHPAHGTPGQAAPHGPGGRP
ncbi:CGNR zinc finger domain-containing protein [Kitasatospora sp. NPDC048540]|uniref:CGNR zinc finger domain-containing protein n=1 Tax=Kitasatospora sp. NPDC048540 TaxID=3155634 RepID=UPI0033CB115C